MKITVQDNMNNVLGIIEYSDKEEYEEVLESLDNESCCPVCEKWPNLKPFEN